MWIGGIMSNKTILQFGAVSLTLLTGLLIFLDYDNTDTMAIMATVFIVGALGYKD